MANSTAAVMAAPRALASRLARVDLLVLGGIILLGAWLRLSHLGLQSYWFDEAVTVRIVDQSFSAMIDAIPRSESTPPLYYVVAWLWTRVAGVSEVGVRSLSAVAGVATLPLVWAAGRRLAGSTAGLVAAGLCAANPTLVWYSQEARSYALMAFLGALSFLLFAMAWERASWPRLAAWALAGALGLATHYFMVFIFLPEAAALLWRWWRSQRQRVLAAVASVCVVGIALLPLAREQEASGRTAWIAASSLGERIKQTGQELLTAGTHSVTTGTLPRSSWSVPALALLVGAVAVGLWRGEARERLGAALAGAIGAAVIVLPLALTLTPLDFFQDRNLLAAWIPLSVAAGAALSTRRAAPVGLLAAGLLVVMGVWVDQRVVREPSLQRADWRALAHALGPASQPRAILLQPSFAVAPLAVYGHATRAMRPGTSLRELVVVGELGPAGAPPAVPGGFGLVQRWRRRQLSLLRYRAPAPVALTPPAWAQAPPLRLEVPAARTG